MSVRHQIEINVEGISMRAFQSRVAEVAPCERSRPREGCRAGRWRQTLLSESPERRRNVLADGRNILCSSDRFWEPLQQLRPPCHRCGRIVLLRLRSPAFIRQAEDRQAEDRQAEDRERQLQRLQRQKQAEIVDRDLVEIHLERDEAHFAIFSAWKCEGKKFTTYDSNHLGGVGTLGRDHNEESGVFQVRREKNKQTHTLTKHIDTH
jgi:hypothetical protein